MHTEIPERLDLLLLLGSVQLRGSSSRSLSLADRLIAQRVRLRVVMTEPMLEVPKSWKKIDLRVSQYLNTSVWQSLARRCLAADLEEAPPSLIDIQHRSMHAAGSWLARRLRVPYLVTVHDYLRDRERFTIDPEWCRGVIAVSESVRSELLERTQLREDQVIVIPSGVQPVPEADLPMVLGADHDPVIGTASPLEAGKGLHHFLKTAARVLQTSPNALFLIAGSGPEERSLRRTAEQLHIDHAVSILSNLRDFNAALRAMDVFVMPALKQGLGSIMLEAMARGLPVIASESGGVFSVITDTQTGLLVPPSNEAALAEKIQFLLTNPTRAQELGRAARLRVSEHFHLDRMVASTMELYRQVLAGQKLTAPSAESI